MSEVKGKVEAVARKGEAEKAKIGDYFQKGIKVGGKWYNVCGATAADIPEINRGDEVTFTPDDKNRAGGSKIKIVKGEPYKGGGGFKKGGGYDSKGIKVGHAVNNAVQIAVAEGQASDFDFIAVTAGEILRLAARIEKDYDNILKGESSTGSSSDPSDFGGGSSDTPDQDFDDAPPF